MVNHFHTILGFYAFLFFTIQLFCEINSYARKKLFHHDICSQAFHTKPQWHEIHISPLRQSWCSAWGLNVTSFAPGGDLGVLGGMWACSGGLKLERGGGSVYALPLAVHSHHQTSSSLMSPLGTTDLPPRGPFTWLTKVKKQTFFFFFHNSPISLPKHYQALHWHSIPIQSAFRKTTGFTEPKPLRTCEISGFVMCVRCGLTFTISITVWKLSIT